MSGFVASPSSPEDPSDCSADMVDGGGFFPPVEISAFRDTMRVGEVITEPRAREALRGGILTVRRELKAWAAKQVAAGYIALDAVPCEEVDFEPELVVMYRRAVFAFAAADLAETHSDISATKEGADRNEERSLTADEHRRNGTHAVRDILGVGRTSVELI